MTVRTVVFLGPSLPAARARVIAGAAVALREPARRGDVYRAIRGGATRVALIDGYFGAGPSVNHKEILWGLEAGCRIWGGASLGALRAAELHTFGMTGVGLIFERFRSGELDRDDEVALTHAPAELAYAPLSEPLIHIRIAVEEAVEAGALAAALGAAVLDAAVAMPFAARSLAAAIAASGIDPAARLAADRALREHWRDQKAADAEAVIAAATAEASPTGPRATFTFHDTFFFERLRGFEDNPVLRTLEF